MEARKSKKADLENKRTLFLQIGLIVTLIAVFMAFEYKSYEKFTLAGVSVYMDNTVEENIPVTIHKNKPLPVPPTPMRRIEIVDDTEETTDVPLIDVNVTNETENTTYLPPIEDEPERIDDVPFIIVENMPEFPGGLGQLYRYLGDNIKYPQIAKEIGTQGTVYINFIVEKDGSITGISLLRGIGGGCNEEALRVVQSMPHWKPGMQMGKPVRVSYNLPIKFTLK